MNWDALLHALLTNRSTLIDVTSSLIIIILLIVVIPIYLIRRKPREGPCVIKLYSHKQVTDKTLSTHTNSMWIELMENDSVAVVWCTDKTVDPLTLQFLTSTSVILHRFGESMATCTGGLNHVMCIKPALHTAVRNKHVHHDGAVQAAMFYSPKGYRIRFQTYRSRRQWIRQSMNRLKRWVLWDEK